MNHWVLRTNGTWDGTTLHNNGEEVPATELFLEINCGLDELGEPMWGGVSCDGDLTAFVRLNAPGTPEVPIFPGQLDIETPRHRICLENFNPIEPAVPNTLVWLDGRQVQLNLLRLLVHLDYERNIIGGEIEVYKDHLLGLDEIISLPIL